VPAGVPLPLLRSIPAGGQPSFHLVRVYYTRVPYINIYVPKALHKVVKDLDLPVSEIAQFALRREIRSQTGRAWDRQELDSRRTTTTRRT
jgi:post-segregation antitoxin (ccd killing protein)